MNSFRLYNDFFNINSKFMAASTLKYMTLADPFMPMQPRHLAYYEYGAPENPKTIICVHGLSRNSLDFGYLAQYLSEKYRVICPDIAGRGNSDWLVNGQYYNYATYVADITLLLKNLSLTQIDWIGTSMGGIIGMMMAAGNPGLIRRLVLNDIGAIVLATGLKRILGYVGTSGIFASKDDAMAYLKSTLAPFGLTSETEWQYMLQISCNVLPDGKYSLRYDPAISEPFRNAAKTGTEITDIDLSAFWKPIACPTLILRGENSDILSSQTAQDMAHARPDVTLKEFAGAGHAPALLSAAQIMVITDWLDITH